MLLLIEVGVLDVGVVELPDAEAGANERELELKPELKPLLVELDADSGRAVD